MAYEFNLQYDLAITKMSLSSAVAEFPRCTLQMHSYMNVQMSGNFDFDCNDVEKVRLLNNFPFLSRIRILLCCLFGRGFC